MHYYSMTCPYTRSPSWVVNHFFCLPFFIKYPSSLFLVLQHLILFYVLIKSKIIRRTWLKRNNIWPELMYIVVHRYFCSQYLKMRTNILLSKIQIFQYTGINNPTQILILFINYSSFKQLFLHTLNQSENEI